MRKTGLDGGAAAVDYDTARRLQIPTMAGVDLDESPTPPATLPGVAVDAAIGITTGISAADRARTALTIASPGSVPARSVPARAPAAGSGERARVRRPPSLTVGALALVATATRVPAAVVCELVSPVVPTEMATPDEAVQLAHQQRIPVVTLTSVR